MTYTRPAYSDVLARIKADLAEMPAALREVLSVAMAKTDHGIHGHLDWNEKQCSPLTCDEARLSDWAALYGVDRLTATAATGAVLATGVAGTQLLANTLVRGPNGLDYVVVSAVVLGAGNTSVLLRCAATGTDGNLVSGQVLTLVDPVPGCANTLTVDVGGLSGGEAAESVDNWRARVAEEWRVIVTRGARSGKDDDYRFWAKSAHPSVTGALIQRHALGIGTVLVRPICNGLVDRLPTAAVLEAVSDYLDSLAPATADWRVVAPIARTINPSLHLLPGYDTVANRTAITAALTTAVMAESAESAVLTLAEIDAAIATVTTQYNRVAPTVDQAAGAGEVLVLSDPAWL